MVIPPYLRTFNASLLLTCVHPYLTPTTPSVYIAVHTPTHRCLHIVRYRTLAQLNPGIALLRGGGIKVPLLLWVLYRGIPSFQSHSKKKYRLKTQLKKKITNVWLYIHFLLDKDLCPPVGRAISFAYHPYSSFRTSGQGP